MNPEAQKILEAICKKDVHELTQSDCAFLRARVSYLDGAMLEKYDSILSDDPIAEGQEHVLSESPQQITESPVVDEVQKLDGVSIYEMTIEELKIVAQHMKIKGAQFYKDTEKLRAVVLKEQSQTSQ